MFLIECRLAGVSDLIAADARYHLKCYNLFMRKADCEKKTRKGSDPKYMGMRKVAYEVSIGNIELTGCLGKVFSAVVRVQGCWQLQAA